MIPFTKNFAKNATEFSWAIYGTSVKELFCKRSVFENFAKLIGNRLCWSLFLNKVVALQPETLLKKRLRHRCFHVNFAKFSRTLSLRDCLVFYYFKRDYHYAFLSVVFPSKTLLKRYWKTFLSCQ